MNAGIRPGGALLVALLVTTSAGTVDGQEAEPTDADAVARELSNPVGSLASLGLQGTYTRFGGSATDAGNQNSSALIFMPTLPFKVGSGNLAIRPSFPVAAAPSVDSAGTWQKKYGLGDIVLLANWGRVEESGMIWGFGGTFILPTATNDLGQNQWQAGPAALIGVLKDWGVLGAFWQHWWGLNSDEGDTKANKGTLQLFYWFSLPGGWQVGGSPIPTANYVTAADIDFTLPLNLGVAKTFVLGKTPLKTTLQGQYFLTRPDVFGPDWGVFFQITPVVKVPW